MNNLSEYTWLLRKLQLKLGQTLPRQGDSKEGELLHLLIHENISDDEALSQRIYDQPSGSSAFRMLKSRVLATLDKELLHEFILNDSRVDTNGLISNLSKEVILIEIYERSGARKNAYRVAYRGYKVALKNFLYPELKRILLYILSYYVYVSNGAKYRYYKSILTRVQRTIAIEAEIFTLYNELQLVVNSKTDLTHSSTCQACQHLLKTSEKKLPPLPSLLYQLYRCRIASLLFYEPSVPAISQETLLSEWKDLENFAKLNAHIITPELLLEITENITKALLLSEEIEEVRKLLFFSESYHKNKLHPSLLKFKKWDWIIANRSGDMERSKQIIQEVMPSKLFSSLDYLSQVEWHLIYALHTLYYKDEALPQVLKPEKNKLNTFSRRSSLNLNIWVYIIEIANAYIQKDIIVSTQKLDAFRKYVKRHIETDLSERLNWFMKLLYHVITHGSLGDTPRIQKMLQQLESRKTWITGPYIEYLPLPLLVKRLARS